MSEKQIQEQVMKAQGYAVDIEHILCNIFECNRYGFGGEVNSDSIRKHPFLSMTQGLAYAYALHPEKRINIDAFIKRFSFYADMSLDELLSFDTNSKIIGITTKEIEKENGLEQVEYMIAEFKSTLK